MSADTVVLDATRAMGVLNAAIKAQMFPDGSIPEGDDDKIRQAEQIIELARQAYTVALEIGPANVPMYQAVVAVLAEAQILPASTPEPQPVAVAPPPTAGGDSGYDSTPGAYVPADAAAVPWPTAQDVADVNAMAAGLSQVYGTQAAQEQQTPVQGTAGGDASFTADPPAVPEQPAIAPPPPPPAPPEPTGVEYPQVNETWADASGGQWIIEIGGHGPQLQVRSASTGEQTLVPAGFLAQRVSLAPAVPTQEAPPSTSPASPSSPPQPSLPPSPSTQAGSPPPVQPPEPSSPSPSSSSDPASPASSPPPSPSPSATERSPASATDDDEGDPQYATLLEGVEADYLPTAMPVPMDLESPPDSMPEDLTMVGDLDQRRLHSQFNALQARARYLRGLEDAKARGCSRLRKSYMKMAMRAARAELGKEASVTEVKELAEEATDVKPWIEREERHRDRAEAYKTFFDMYSENVTVLSRDWTMRDQEQRGS